VTKNRRRRSATKRKASRNGTPATQTSKKSQSAAAGSSSSDRSKGAVGLTPDKSAGSSNRAPKSPEAATANTRRTRPPGLLKGLASGRSKGAADSSRERHFNRRMAIAGLAVAVVAGVVAVVAIHVAHQDARHPPTPAVTQIEAFSPGGPATQVDDPHEDLDCAWKSAVSERREAMTWMLVDSMLFDPCFNVDPMSVVCPSAKSLEEGSELFRYRIGRLHQFVHGPPTEPKALDYVEAFDLPWAVQVAGTEEWCYRRHWVDPTQLGLTEGSRPYVCRSESVEHFMNGADAFFSNRSRAALVIKLKNRTTQAGLWTNTHGHALDSAVFRPRQFDHHPVQISKVVY
jgi:hypothetical protein